MRNMHLEWAARNGDEAIVQLLLSREDIDPEKPAEDSLKLWCWLLAIGMNELWKCYSDEKISTPTSWMGTVKNLSIMLLHMGAREWWEYYSDETTSTTTSQTDMAKNHSRTLPPVGTREYWKYYSASVTSIPPSQIWTAKSHSAVLPALDMRG